MPAGDELNATNLEPLLKEISNQVFPWDDLIKDITKQDIKIKKILQNTQKARILFEAKLA